MEHFKLNIDFSNHGKLQTRNRIKIYRIVFKIDANSGAKVN